MQFVDELFMADFIKSFAGLAIYDLSVYLPAGFYVVPLSVS